RLTDAAIAEPLVIDLVPVAVIVPVPLALEVGDIDVDADLEDEARIVGRGRLHDFDLLAVDFLRRLEARAALILRIVDEAEVEIAGHFAFARRSGLLLGRGRLDVLLRRLIALRRGDGLFGDRLFGDRLLRRGLL